MEMGVFFQITATQSHIKEIDDYWRNIPQNHRAPLNTFNEIAAVDNIYFFALETSHHRSYYVIALQ